VALAGQLQGSADRRSNLAVLAWLIYGLLCGTGFWFAGSLCGFAAMALIVTSEHRRRTVKIMDITSLGYFGAATIMAARDPHATDIPSRDRMERFRGGSVGDPDRGVSIHHPVRARTVAPGGLAYPVVPADQRDVDLGVVVDLYPWRSAGGGDSRDRPRVYPGGSHSRGGEVAGFIFSNRYPKRFTDQVAASSTTSAAIGEASH
jgi:hypothetical protein